MSQERHLKSQTGTTAAPLPVAPWALSPLGCFETDSPRRQARAIAVRRRPVSGEIVGNRMQGASHGPTHGGLWMLVGIVTSHRTPALPAGLEGAVRLVHSPTVESVLGDLLLDRCDVALAPAGAGPSAAAAGLSGAGAIRPVSSVWSGPASDGSWTLVAAGRFGRGFYPAEAEARVGSLAAMREVWLQGWARRVGAILRPLRAGDILSDLPARCFLEALRTRRAPDLASALRLSQRSLQRGLAGVGFLGPKQFLLAARALQAWEYTRVGFWSLERIAYRLGYASLSTMDRSFRAVFRLAPSQLRSLGEAQVAALLAGIVRRRGSAQKGQIQTKKA